MVDLGLPDRPGDELVDEIRALHPNIPIILATGYADEGVRNRFANVERLQMLTKQFSADDLNTALKGMGIRATKGSRRT
jgi:CheY-like chemotaxis protein